VTGHSTAATAINESGTVVGVSGFALSLCCWTSQHPPNQATAFIRTSDGAFTEFQKDLATAAFGINNQGEITGSYLFENGQGFFVSGFLRTPDGTITPFDAPGTPAAGIQPPGGTYAVAISDQSKITGYFSAAGGVTHGFVRDFGGAINEFDVTGAIITQPAALSPTGVIVGAWTDTGTRQHAFVREVNERIATFDVPGATSTRAVSINARGDIVGTYADAAGVTHGFLRGAAGRLLTLDAPGLTGCPPAGITTPSPCGTFPTHVSETGAITGYFTYPLGQHGFLIEPWPGEHAAKD
jgi:hypothetical protein